MVPTLESLGIDRLTVDERIALVTAIWDSIAADTPAPVLTDEQRAELARRLAEHKANPADVVPWEEIKAAALARFEK